MCSSSRAACPARPGPWARESEKKDAKSSCAPSFYGKTARRFALPQEIDEARANAKFAHGLLELTLPKKAVVTGRKLEIN